MKQITLVVKDEPGVLASISELLAGKGINIEDMSAETTGNVGVIIVVVDQYDRALAVMTDAGYHPLTEDVLVVRLRDEPGALARVSRRFYDAGINIRSVRFIRREQGYAFVAISTDRTEESLAVVKDLVIANA